MANSTSKHTRLLIGIGIGIVIGSVVSGTTLRGALTDTGPCLSQALGSYLTQQNTLIVNHTNAIQSIVSKLQSKVQKNNGATIETDFADVMTLFQAEDLAYTQKIKLLSENYKASQTKCQPTKKATQQSWTTTTKTSTPKGNASVSVEASSNQSSASVSRASSSLQSSASASRVASSSVQSSASVSRVASSSVQSNASVSSVTSSIEDDEDMDDGPYDQDPTDDLSPY